MNTQYNIEKWAAETTVGKNLFIWKFFLKGKEMPGWELSESYVREDSKNVVVKEYYWGNKENTDQSIKMDVFETSSWKDAQRLLLTLLENHMAINLTEARDRKIELGDVAYTGLGEIVQHILFARANMVVIVNSIGKKDISVDTIAKKLDELFYTIPGPSETGLLPPINLFSVTLDKLYLNQKAGLKIEASDLLGSSAWFKFYSENGEVLKEDGNLFFIPSSRGENQLSVFAIGENGLLDRKTIVLRTEES